MLQYTGVTPGGDEPGSRYHTRKLDYQYASSAMDISRIPHTTNKADQDTLDWRIFLLSSKQIKGCQQIIIIIRYWLKFQFIIICKSHLIFCVVFGKFDIN